MVSLRSSVDTIVQCYTDTGYKPCINSFFERGKKCCPISAIYMKNYGPFGSKIKLDTREKAIISKPFSDYEAGFLRGYDIPTPYFNSILHTKEFERGIKKGQAVRKRLEELKLLKN